MSKITDEKDNDKTPEQKEWYKTGLGIIIIIGFFPFTVPYLVWTKTKWNKWLKIGITLLMVLLVVVPPINNYLVETETKRNEEKYKIEKQETWKEAVNKMENGNFQEAIPLFQKLGNEDGKQFIKDMQMIQDSEYQVWFLSRLNNEEFEQLKNGTLVRKVTKNKRLNEIFLEKVRKIADIDNIRSEAIKEIEIKNQEINKESKERKKWYEGGTLHSATIKEWTNEEYSNKLATSGDWLAKFYQSKKLNTSVVKVKEVDDLKPYAEETVICLDTATKDIKEIENNKISEMAVFCMIEMDYIKK